MNKPTASHSGWKLTTIFFDTALRNNLVLVQAIGVCPIIMAGADLKSGVALALCTLITLLPLSLLMSLIGKKVANWLQPVLYTGVAALLLVGTAIVLDKWVSTALYAKLHLFIPLMAVNTIVSYRVGGFSIGNRPAAAVMDSLAAAFGFGLVIAIVSAIRELVSTNTIWNIPVGISLPLPEAAQPFTAFILLGMMAAGLQWLTHRRKDSDDEVELLTADNGEEGTENA